MKLPLSAIFCLMLIQTPGLFAQKVKKQPGDIIERLMKDNPDQFGDILKNRDALKVQIIYTQIDRKKNNKPVFTNYYFNVNRNNYYYPASTVKLPTALLALQRLQEMKSKGIDRNSSMITEAKYSKQTAVYNDPTTPDGRPTVEHYIKKIFLVSDNDAFNRLYEFLGQEYINKELHEMGYPDVDILHHLDLYMTEDENRHTNPVRFYSPTSTLLFAQDMQVSQIAYPKRTDSIAKAYYSGGKLINQPMNFSMKNRFPLEDAHNVLRSIMFPSSVKKSQRFKISKDDQQLVWKYLSAYPSEAEFPPYDTANYWDAYGKLLYWGAEKGTLPKTFRSFSKEGDAYGFLIDVAYVVDFSKRIEFMLSAVIYCNSDGIMNDDQYDYEKVGFPFMKNLGRMIYYHELKRKHTVIPNLSEFQMDYGK